ncbi:MAG: FIVAR domain-containing protein [Treponema sp.]|nr:FIVAR domain-containing protein [Treponema sp.]
MKKKKKMWEILAILLVFGLVFAGCEGSGDGEVDTSVLEAKITEAEDLAASTLTSVSGSDVPVTAQWVTSAQKTTFENAISAAKNVVDTATSQSQVNTAVTTLTSAITVFNGLRTAGSAPPVNYVTLNARIAEAEFLRDSVVVNTDAENVAQGMFWVTAGDLATFEAAITTAINARTAATQGAVNAAVTALEAAITAFDNATTEGSKTSGFTEDELIALIAIAEAAKEGIETSDENGDDVPPSIFWVTAGDLAAFETAISDADDVLGSGDYDGAYQALVTALNNFNDAKELGTEPDRYNLLLDINDAAELLRTVAVAANAQQAPLGSEWVTPAQWALLDAAYQEALEVMSNTNATKKMVDEAETELGIAIGEFLDDVFENGPGERQNSITITGWDNKYDGEWVNVGLFKSANPSASEIEDPEIYGWGRIDNGTLKVELYIYDSKYDLIDPWIGTGSWFVGLGVQTYDRDEYYISNNAVTWTASETNPSINFSTGFKAFVPPAFSITAGGLAEREGIVIPPGGMTLNAFFILIFGINYDLIVTFEGDILFKDSELTIPFTGGDTIFSDTIFYSEFPFGEDRGEKIGELTGTITLTDIPSPAPIIQIGVWGYHFDGHVHDEWDSWGGRVNITGSSSSGTFNWSIPVYENDGFIPDVEFECYFVLWVMSTVTGDSFEISISEPKTINQSQPGVVGALGPVSLKTVTLSGTLNVTYDGVPVPEVGISAWWWDDDNHDWISLGWTELRSPALGAAWSIMIPAPTKTITVTFDVNGYDPYEGWLFGEYDLTPTEVSPLDTAKTGITLDLGNITGGGPGGGGRSIIAPMSSGIEPEPRRGNRVRQNSLIRN